MKHREEGLCLAFDVFCFFGGGGSVGLCSLSCRIDGLCMFDFGAPCERFSLRNALDSKWNRPRRENKQIHHHNVVSCLIWDCKNNS